MTSKGIVFYTDGRLEQRIYDAVIAQLEQADIPGDLKVSVFPGDGNRPGALTMFRQILDGLEASKADVVFLTEHDVLYHPSHFDFTPPGRAMVWYNTNVWQVRVSDGLAVRYTAKRVSQLCAYRDVLLEHYRRRIEKVERQGFSMRMGFEPGSHGRAERVDDLRSGTWESEYPNLDLKHGHNLTPARWSQAEFRDQRNCQDWQESEKIPYWGTVRGRMDAVLAAVTLRPRYCVETCKPY